MRTPLLAFSISLCLALPARCSPLWKYFSVDGRSQVNQGIDRTESCNVSGRQSYALPNRSFGWAAISCDGRWVVLVNNWEMIRFDRGQESCRAPIPLALLGRLAGGWVSEDGSVCYLETSSEDLWCWRPGGGCSQVEESQLPQILAQPGVSPDAALRIAVQHRVSLPAQTVRAWHQQRVDPYPTFTGTELASMPHPLQAYDAWKGGATHEVIRGHFVTPWNVGGKPAILAFWKACGRHLPRRLITEPEWQQLERAIDAPGSDTVSIIQMLAWGGRVRLTPRIAAALASAMKDERTEGLSLGDVLALGCAERPEKVLEHLSWRGSQADEEDDNWDSYILLFQHIDCPAAVPGLIRLVSSPDHSIAARRALWHQLRVDLGSDPSAWEAWVRQAHHGVEERGRALLASGDPAGLLWLGRSDSEQVASAQGQPRLVAVVGVPEWSQNPWVRDSRVGIGELGRFGWAQPAQNWCWEGRTGTPCHPLPRPAFIAQVEADTGRVTAYPRQAFDGMALPTGERPGFTWSPDPRGAYQLGPARLRASLDSPTYLVIEPANVPHPVEPTSWERRSEIGARLNIHLEELAVPPGPGLDLAAASQGELLLLDPESLTARHTLHGLGRVSGLAFDPSGRHLAVLCPKELRVYDLQPRLGWTPTDRQLLSELWTGMRLQGGGAVALSPDEYWNRVRTWERTTGCSWWDGQPPLPRRKLPISAESAAGIGSLALLVAVLWFYRRQRSLRE